MKLERYDDPRAFQQIVEPMLLLDEPRHHLMLGLLHTLVSTPHIYPSFHLWLVQDDGRPIAAAMRTPPFNIVLAAPVTEAALGVLAAGIATENEQPPGVIGAVPEATTFADAYCATTDRIWQKRFDQGIYALQTVNDVPQPSGSMRAADVGDEELVLSWLHPFMGEANHQTDWDEAGARRRLRSRLAGGQYDGYRLWCDPEPVSMTGLAGGTPSGVRVGPVYTPPEHRRRGYATALVAHASREVIDSGKRHCFLYTDMSNPTSNAIYQRIGYELSCRSVMLRFVAA